jgi:hypothetical protein
MAEQQLPWQRQEFDGWAIVGMNHYHKSGGRFLFVAMVKGERCIKIEGVDTPMLWRDLAALAQDKRG